uniref:Uncharacterized protein n=1 Tax=viral metagenome TaxID=1070528 RepID=A0A6C0JXM3_9ZZZZ
MSSQLKNPPPLSRVDSQSETPRINPVNGVRRVGNNSDAETKSENIVKTKKTLKKLENDPYYKKLMSCSCAKTPDSKGFPKILPKKPASGPSSNSYPPSSLGSGSLPLREKNGKCITGSVSKGTITFQNFPNNGQNTKKNYTDYGVNITLPDGTLYTNRCFILSLAHVLGIDVCEFYGNVIKILQNNPIPPNLLSRPEIEKLKNKNIDELHAIEEDASLDKEERELAGNIANYINEKTVIMSNGKKGRTEYIDGSLLLKYFNFDNLLSNGLILLITDNYQFNTNLVNSGSTAKGGGVYINPSGNINGRPTLDTPIIYNLGDTHYVVGDKLTDQGLLDSIIERCNNMTGVNNDAPFNYPAIINSTKQTAGSRNRKTRKLKKTRKSKKRKNNRKTRRR